MPVMVGLLEAIDEVEVELFEPPEATIEVLEASVGPMREVCELEGGMTKLPDALEEPPVMVVELAEVEPDLADEAVVFVVV